MTIDKTALLPEGLEAAAARLRSFSGINDNMGRVVHGQTELMRQVADFLDVQNARPADGEPVDGADAAAIEIADAVLAWMVKYDLLDADQEYRDDDVIAVLDELSPPSAQGEPVAVKGLEWSIERRSGFNIHIGRGIGLQYEAAIKAYSPGWIVTLGESEVVFDATDADEIVAKAAAQADYEQRIRSALSPAPSLAVSDGMVEAAVSVFEKEMGVDDRPSRREIKDAITAAIGARHE